MIIRSQDKKAITDDLKLYIRENDFTRGKVKWEIRNAEQDLLATYSTEAKAIKVLDMICEKYKEPIVRANYTDNESLIYANSVFQMPQDSEV